MKRFIIDTDGSTDDGAAIICALRDPNIKIEAITTVAGSWRTVDMVTPGVCAFVEEAGTYHPPIYEGMNAPIYKYCGKKRPEPKRNIFEHVSMPQTSIVPENDHAVDAIARLVEENPGELELITLGPVTNIAYLCLKAPETVRKIKKITAMAGIGDGFGNASPVAEGNVHMDAEAFDIMLQQACVPIVLVGWDMSLEEYMINEDEYARIMRSGSKTGTFCLKLNHWLVELNTKWFNRCPVIDLPDAVTVAVAAQPDMIIEYVEAYTRVQYNNSITYGEILIDRMNHYGKKANAVTCTKLDLPKLKKYIIKNMI